MKKQLRKRFTIVILAAVLLVLGVMSSQAAPAGPDSEQAVAAEKPDVLVQESFREWAVGGGFIYWAERCSLGPDSISANMPAAGQAEYPLRRLPTGGGRPRTLVVAGDGDCETFLNMTADASGVYYYNASHGRLEGVPAAAPPGAKPVIVRANVSAVDAGLALDADSVFYADDRGQIIRAAKDGSSGGVVITGLDRVKDLRVDGSHLYWIDQDGFWWAPKSCTSSPCTKTRLYNISGESFVLGDESSSSNNQPRVAYLVFSGATWRIQRLACSIIQGEPLQCTVKQLYTATISARIGHPARVRGGTLTSPKEWLYWMEKSGVDSRLRRLQISSGGGAAVDLFEGNSVTVTEQVAVDSNFVYFADRQSSNERIMRLPLGADPLQRDLAFAQWEVTQGVQSLLHDVDLVAGKTTFVRVFGRQLDGRRANNVEAGLYGYRGTVELPGSPLMPVKNWTQSLANNESYDRSDRQDGWVFRLPRSWTEAGAITLRAEVDPHHLYTDDNRNNNDNQGVITFVPGRSPCAVFIPVLTEQPLPVAFGNPHFMPMVDLVRNMWPVSGIVTYQQTPALTENGGPFEMEDDYIKVVKEVRRRWAMGDHPVGCPGTSRHFFVGMVHANTNSGVYGGVGQLPGSASWVKVPDANQNYDMQSLFYPEWLSVGPGFVYQYSFGATLAHEMSHNAGRKHVDCPSGKPAHTDPDWPYKGFECRLDDQDADRPQSHFGFQSRLLAPIPGNLVRDYMAYMTANSYSPQWISDYTSRGLYDWLCADANDCPADLAQTVGAGSLVSTQATLLVSGMLGETTSLDKVWLFPAGSVSQAVGERWLAMATEQHARRDEAAAPAVTIRLLDGSGSLLATEAIVPEQVSDGSEKETESFFVAPITIPANVAASSNLLSAVELWADGVRKQTIRPGERTPQVSILRPAGGENIGGPLTVSWEVVDDDEDALEFLIQYSPDRGASWFTVVGPLPAGRGKLSMEVDLSGLPGSRGQEAQVRVVATDGLHTTIETSSPFSVPDRAPLPSLNYPLDGRQFTAGEPINFEGEALDPEDGSLSGEALSWRLDGRLVGTGSDLTVNGLEPGAHEVTLIAEDSAANQGEAAAAFTVAPLKIPTGNAPFFDGYCNDSTYADAAARVFLAAYDNGRQGVARAIRNGDSVWVCLSNLQRSGNGPEMRAGVRLDPDHSGSKWAAEDDYAFFAGEDGTPEIRVGDKLGGLRPLEQDGLAVKVSASEAAWQVEMKIAIDFFQGWDHLAGLAFVHEPSPGIGYRWPARADATGPISPDSWGTAVLGERPQIFEIGPEQAKAGGDGFTLTVKGRGFVPGSQVTWDGQPLPTQYISENDLTAQVPAANIQQGGYIALRVANPNMLAAPSDKLLFPIQNPQPLLDSITPQEAQVGARLFTLEARGSGFTAGAQLLWNGQPLATDVVSDSLLRATVAKTDLGLPGQISIVVHNPPPGGGSSEAREFTVHSNDDTTLDQALFLPVLRRP